MGSTNDMKMKHHRCLGMNGESVLRVDSKRQPFPRNPAVKNRGEELRRLGDVVEADTRLEENPNFDPELLTITRAATPRVLRTR